MPINRAPFNALIDDDGSGATGTPWNKTQIAGVLLDPADAAYLSIPVAQDLVFAGNHTIRRNTGDGADNGYLFLAGGGAANQAQGALIAIHGNESSSPGSVAVAIGNVAGSAFTVLTGGGSPSLTVQNTGVTTAISTVSKVLHIESTNVNGPYVQLAAPSGVNTGFIGAGSALIGGTPADLVLRCDAGSIKLQALAGAIYLDPVYTNVTSSGAANVLIDSGGVLRRFTSSRRYKTDIAPLTEWAPLLAVEPVTFRAMDASSQVGLIAEQVADVDPRFATYGPDGAPDGIATHSLIAPIIKGLQDLHARLTALEERTT